MVIFMADRRRRTQFWRAEDSRVPTTAEKTGARAPARTTRACQRTRRRRRRCVTMASLRYRGGQQDGRRRAAVSLVRNERTYIRPRYER